jgi:hypothetical protein
MTDPEDVDMAKAAKYCLEAAARIGQHAGWDWHGWMKQCDLSWKGKEGETTQQKEKKKEKKKKKDKDNGKNRNNG